MTANWYIWVPGLFLQTALRLPATGSRLTLYQLQSVALSPPHYDFNGANPTPPRKRGKCRWEPAKSEVEVR